MAWQSPWVFQRPKCQPIVILCRSLGGSYSWSSLVNGIIHWKLGRCWDCKSFAVGCGIDRYRSRSFVWWWMWKQRFQPSLVLRNQCIGFSLVMFGDICFTSCGVLNKSIPFVLFSSAARQLLFFCNSRTPSGLLNSMLWDVICGTFAWII